MNDEQIVELYWNRSENAIFETSNKYSKYCHTIAYNILQNHEDSEECVNDAYMKLWNTIPPKKPNCLATFLGKITRNLALNMYEKYTAKKRGGSKILVVLEELSECIPSSTSVEQVIQEHSLIEIINKFLVQLPADKRKIFIRRYWYLSSIKEIAKEYHFTESKVKMRLFRVRNEFKEFLEKEGVVL